jgi:gliding motility-associated-like protein
VTSEPAPAITGITSVNISCNGVCDGSLTIATSGGTGLVQYSIGGAFQPSGIFSGLCAGTYNISVTDDNSCVTNYGAPYVITEPAILTLATTQTDLTCFDNGTGTIDFDAQGGTQPYLYSITNGSQTTSNPFFTLLDAGTYDLQVTDDNGCTATGQVTLTQPPLLEIIDLQTSDALCFETCNGSAEVFAQGGTITTGYTYNWYTVTNNTNTQQVADLCAGGYTSVVLDQNGCYDTVQFTITEPAPMVFDSIVATNVLCNGSCDGTITLWSSTATLYSFDGGQTFGASNTATGLCQGSYHVIAQSPDGCLASIDSVLLADPPMLTVVAGPDSTLCAGTAGYLNAQASGGTEPYTYYWNGQNESPNLVVIPVATTSYNLYVLDANGCLSNYDSTLLALYQDLTIAVLPDTTICPGEEVELTANAVTGVPAFSYEWYQNGVSIAGTAETTVSPSVPTSYVVVAEDLCTSVSDTVTITTFTLPELTFEAVQQTGCTPMEVVLNPVADPQLLGGNCTWVFSDGTVVNGCGQITATFTDPGCYSATFTGTTAEGCALEGSGEDIFCVVPNPTAQFTYNPQQPTYLSSEVQFTNYSQNADTYNWTFTGYPGSQEENPGVNFIHTETGQTITVCLTATNFLGCSDETCVEIVMADEFTLYVPNAFTPDDDIYNPVFSPVFPSNFHVDDYELLIFDRWGEILFESHDPAVGWNGTYSGQVVQDGVYTWKINVKEVAANKYHTLVGHVTLIR